MQRSRNTVPIIPGLKPISTKKQLNLIPHRFSVELPDDLIMEVVKAKDNEEVKQIGIEWCIAQSKELVKAGIPVLHYYSMGKSENIQKIAESQYSKKEYICYFNFFSEVYLNFGSQEPTFLFHRNNNLF